MREHPHPEPICQPTRCVSQPEPGAFRSILHCGRQLLFDDRTCLAVAESAYDCTHITAAPPKREANQNQRHAPSGRTSGPKDATTGNHGDLERAKEASRALPVQSGPQYETSHNHLERHLEFECRNNCDRGMGSRRTSVWWMEARLCSRSTGCRQYQVSWGCYSGFEALLPDNSAYFVGTDSHGAKVYGRAGNG